MTAPDTNLEPWLTALEAPGVFAQAERTLHERMRETGIQFGDGLLPTFVTPYIVDGGLLDRWASRSEALATSVEEIAQETLRDRALYDSLGLQASAHDLMQIDPGYRRITVLSRPDAIVVDDDRLAIVEFNCDSPAMMSFADAVSDLLLELDVYAPMRPQTPASSMTDALLKVLLSCWREFGGRGTAPRIAISDWENQKTRFEHRRIAAVFEAAGYPTVVCDPRAFRRDGRYLSLDGQRIDIVYRRALFTELLERQTEVDALLGAYRAGTVCMVNSLRSYLASSKTLMAFLSERRTLDDVAATAFLTAPRIAALRDGAPRGVVKRGESHGGLHVLLPGVTTDDDWERGLAAAAADPGPWVEQAYHPVPQLTVMGSESGVAQRQRKYYNWNPFLFDGRHAGSIARVSETPLINITLGGGLLPTWRAPQSKAQADNHVDTPVRGD